jgi:hypothetical protein
MRTIRVYVESDAGMAEDHCTAAWTFDADLWGRCGQGPDEGTALAALADELALYQHALYQHALYQHALYQHAHGQHAHGQQVPSMRQLVVERIAGDEQAFARDHEPATAAERDATLTILEVVRRETLALVDICRPAVLDFDDPDRVLPTWARWRTLRQMAWHLVDTESRYYLTSVGLPGRPISRISGPNCWRRPSTYAQSWRPCPRI